MINFDYDSLNEKTKQILNQLSEEYRELLIKRVIEDNNYNNLKSIDIRNIIEEDSYLKRIMIKKKNERKRERFLKIMILLGLLYILTGIFCYALIYLKTKVFEEQFPMIMMLVGALLIYFSVLFKLFPLMPIYKEKRITPNFNERMDIIDKWNEIELLMYNLNDVEISKGPIIPLSKVLDNLVYKQLITDLDKLTLRQILTIRNSIVHYTEKEVSLQDINNCLTSADKMINKLRSISEK